MTQVTGNYWEEDDSVDVFFPSTFDLKCVVLQTL